MTQIFCACSASNVPCGLDHFLPVRQLNLLNKFPLINVGLNTLTVKCISCVIRGMLRRRFFFFREANIMCSTKLQLSVFLNYNNSPDIWSKNKHILGSWVAKSSCFGRISLRYKGKKVQCIWEYRFWHFIRVLMDLSRWFLEEWSPTWHPAQWMLNYNPFASCEKQDFLSQIRRTNQGQSNTDRHRRNTRLKKLWIFWVTLCWCESFWLFCLWIWMLWLLSRGDKQSKHRTTWSMTSDSSQRGHIGVYQGWLNHQRKKKTSINHSWLAH